MHLFKPNEKKGGSWKCAPFQVPPNKADQGHSVENKADEFNFFSSVSHLYSWTTERVWDYGAAGSNAMNEWNYNRGWNETNWQMLQPKAVQISPGKTFLTFEGKRKSEWNEIWTEMSVFALCYTSGGVVWVSAKNEPSQTAWFATDRALQVSITAGFFLPLSKRKTFHRQGDKDVPLYVNKHSQWWSLTNPDSDPLSVTITCLLSAQTLNLTLMHIQA